MIRLMKLSICINRPRTRQAVNRSTNSTSMSQQYQPPSRTNTRLSDYSQPNGSRLRTSGPGSGLSAQPGADPWTKRNLVAQNVLLKHRAELEQLATATRASKTTAATAAAASPSIQLATTAATTTPSKFLIPEGSKYAKK